MSAPRGAAGQRIAPGGGREAGDEALHGHAVDVDDRAAGGEWGSAAMSAMVMTGATAASAASKAASTSASGRAAIHVGQRGVDLVAVLDPAGEGGEALVVAQPRSARMHPPGHRLGRRATPPPTGRRRMR